MSTSCLCGKPAEAILTGFMLDWLEFDGKLCKECFIAQVFQYVSERKPRIAAFAFRFDLACSLYFEDLYSGDPERIAFAAKEVVSHWDAAVLNRQNQFCSGKKLLPIAVQIKLKR